MFTRIYSSSEISDCAHIPLICFRSRITVTASLLSSASRRPTFPTECAEIRQNNSSAPLILRVLVTSDACISVGWMEGRRLRNGLPHIIQYLSSGSSVIYRRRGGNLLFLSVFEMAEMENCLAKLPNYK
ncbi:hypothetical protein NPIL_82561 [Nephila pilipes]|uniref:Uncharacterized protein n=1 Tax=Nephila pilipes TaxID=299642 RepID=A0A8X6PDC1_NEPPI|nr:hypothetical protein NPIL_82561 [Nephila pilipes]